MNIITLKLVSVMGSLHASGQTTAHVVKGESPCFMLLWKSQESGAATERILHSVRVT